MQGVGRVSGPPAANLMPLRASRRRRGRVWAERPPVVPVASGALCLLLTFYVAAVPLTGEPELRSEGAYLVVNKTLVEAAAVLVILVCRTGRIAGLDRLVSRRADVAPASGAIA